MGKSSLKVASFFSGCGGFDYGFVNDGFCSIGSYDIDPDAVRHLEANFCGPVYQANLENGIPNEGDFKKVDAIIAGPPCQGFSTAGKRDFNDERNHLLPLTAELAVRLNPKVLVVENVRGVLSGKHKEYWERLVTTMRDNGFRTHTLKINTLDLGLPQTRNRVLLFAWRTKNESTFSIPHTYDKTLFKTLSGVSKLPNHKPKLLRVGTTEFKIAQKIKQGQKLCNVRAGNNSVPAWEIPDVFGKTNAKERTVLEMVRRLRRTQRSRSFGDADPVSYQRLREALGGDFVAIVDSLINKGYLRTIGTEIDLAGTFNGKYRRLAWSQPSYTVDTRFGSARYFLHPNRDRGFTVREAARIQGFPDNYIFSGSEKSQYRVIGNAVPIPLSKFAANICKELLGVQ